MHPDKEPIDMFATHEPGYFRVGTAASGREATCATCCVRHLCLPCAGEAHSGARTVSRRIQVTRDRTLYSTDQAVEQSVYAVRYGSFKHCRQDRTGASKITGFSMSGDFLALDSIGLARHECTAVALEDSEVCEISYAAMREQALFFQRVISKSIFDMQAISLQLRRTTAEQRLAGFLLNMATRYGARGYSCTRYRLPMSRQDIAGYLNLTPESVSRLLRQFRQGHLISTDHREMVLLDPAALKALSVGATRHVA